MDTKQSLMYDPNKLPERIGNLQYFYPQLAFVGIGNQNDQFERYYNSTIYGATVKIIDVINYRGTRITTEIDEANWDRLSGKNPELYYFVPHSSPLLARKYPIDSQTITENSVFTTKEIEFLTSLQKPISQETEAQLANINSKLEFYYQFIPNDKKEEFWKITAKLVVQKPIEIPDIAVIDNDML